MEARTQLEEEYKTKRTDLSKPKAKFMARAARTNRLGHVRKRVQNRNQRMGRQSAGILDNNRQLDS